MVTPARFVRVLVLLVVLTLLTVLTGGCGLFGDDAPTFDEAFPSTPEADTATTAPEGPTAVPATAEPQSTVAAVATATAEPTATPQPTWQTATISDGVSFDLPGNWKITDDQAEVDASMETPETVKGLADAGVSGPMDLFGVKVRGIADGPEGERMFYVTIGASPFPTLGLLSALGQPLVEQFGIDVTEKQEISTEIGNALRIEAELEGTTYLAWIWIENAQGRIIILTSLDADVERQLVTTLTKS